MRRSFNSRRVRPAICRLEDRVQPASLLPDLQPLVGLLSGWTLVPTASGGREIRYTTAAANGGAGAFEIRGTDTVIYNPDGSQSQVVNQRIYQDGGGFIEREAGTFKYHAPHGHVHYDDFAWGQVRLRPADQSVGPVVASSPKASFALIDISRYNPSLPNSPTAAVYTTATGVVQGISVGWNDVYGPSLEGQSIDVTGLPDGDYWLELSLDPLNRIEELNEANNVVRVPITLNASPTSGFRILSATPSAALHTPLTSVTINFNGEVASASFTAADVSMTGPAGPIAATGIVALSSVQYRIDFPTQTVAGTYRLIVGPGISNTTGGVLDQNNNGVGGEVDDQFFNNIVITSPHLDSASPVGTVYSPVSSVRLTYNKPMASASFTTADIAAFTGPGGVNLLSSLINVVPLAPGGESAVFDLFFTTQSAVGSYSLTVEPTVLDPLGQAVDQDGDGLSNGADRYTTTFAISNATPVGPDAFGYVATAAQAQSLELVGRPGAFTVIASGDDNSASIDLGTNTFNFYGTTYTGGGQLFVNINGLITFGGANNSPNNDDFAMSSLPTIAVLWDDWKSSTATPALLGYFDDQDSDGTPDRLVLQWNQLWHHPSTPSTVTFQAVLQLNSGATPGNIYFHYADLDAGNTAYNFGASATVGTRSATNSRLLASFSTVNNTAHPLVSSSPGVRISVPTVASIERVGPTLITAGDAEFVVTFSRGVTGVDVADFKLTTTGAISGAQVHHIHATADPAVYEVHVITGSGGGTLRLDLADNDSILDLFGAKLGGVGAGNGGFSRGQAYTVVAPAPTRILATAAGAGDQPGQQGDPFVIAYNPDGSVRFGFYAYDKNFRLGVRVATGDINGDGVSDIITAPGPGGGPHIRVFSGVDGKLLNEFFAFASDMTAGVFVAAGDVDGDGRADIITGAGVGRGKYVDPRVRVFNGLQPNSSPIRDFVAYPTYNVGVTVAAADFNSDGKADILTGPESGNPNVKLFNGANPNGPLLRDFFAYAPTTPGGATYYPVGVTVAAGDFDGDTTPDIITGAGAGGGPHVRVFSGVNAAILREFFAYADAVRGGLRVAALDVNGDNRVEIITAVGPTPSGAAPSLVRFFSSSGAVTRELDPFPSFRGGVFVG